MEYGISSGNSVAKVSTKGGELVSFCNSGVEYVWGGNPQYWGGQAPVLFPTVGALKNDKTEIDGKAYPIQKHGFARKSEFKLIKQTENSVSFSLKSNKETLSNYPFEFELQITHTIFQDGFKTEYKVINEDKIEMLFGIGGHAGFNCPLFSNTQFSDYTILFEQTEDGPVYFTRFDKGEGIIHREDRNLRLEGIKELKLDYSLFDSDAIIIDNLKSHAVKLLNSGNGRGIKFTMSGFQSLGIWTPPFKNAPFICIEPWTVTPDFSDTSGKFNEKPNITRLSPGAVFSTFYEMKLNHYRLKADRF